MEKVVITSNESCSLAKELLDELAKIEDEEEYNPIDIDSAFIEMNNTLEQFKLPLAHRILLSDKFDDKSCRSSHKRKATKKKKRKNKRVKNKKWK